MLAYIHLHHAQFYIARNFTRNFTFPDTQVTQLPTLVPTSIRDNPAVDTKIGKNQMHGVSCQESFS